METDLDRPSHNGSPTELWQFTQGLEDWLPRQSANLRSIIIDGSATVKGKTVVLSPTHARWIKANLVVQADGTAYTRGCRPRATLRITIQPLAQT